ncbi:MAG: hypothetical protein ACL7AX_08825 [Candidatus Arsenophonus phytopathogenicus]
MKPWTLNQLSVYSQNNQYDQVIKALFNHFNINVNLSKPMLIEMLTQTEILSSADKVTTPEQKHYLVRKQPHKLVNLKVQLSKMSLHHQQNTSSVMRKKHN